VLPTAGNSPTVVQGFPPRVMFAIGEKN